MITHPIRVLSVIPPMTQLNTPYPSTAYLTGFLRSRRVDAVQEDLALALVLKLFSAEGLSAIQNAPKRSRSASARRSSTRFTGSSTAISRRSHRPLRFCRDATRPWRTAFAGGSFFPKGRASSPSTSISKTATTIRWLGRSAHSESQDRARHLATLYLTTSPMCCAMRSIRVLSLSATPNRSRKANRPSIRSPKHWQRR